MSCRQANLLLPRPSSPFTPATDAACQQTLPSVQVRRGTITDRKGEETVAVKRLKERAEGEEEGEEQEDLTLEMVAHSLMSHRGVVKLRGYLIRIQPSSDGRFCSRVTGLHLEHVSGPLGEPASLWAYVEGFRERHAADPASPPIAPELVRWRMLQRIMITLIHIHSLSLIHI